MKKLSRLSAAALSLGLATGAVVGAEPAPPASPPVLTVPLCPKPPVIDGRIDPEEWAAAYGAEGFIAGDGLERRQARAWVTADADTIYVALMSRLPDEGALLTAVTTDSLKAVFDDSLEVYVNPTPDAPDRVDYQFLANALGKGGYNIHKLGSPAEAEAWRGDWRQAHGMHEGWWHAEIAIPVASMGLTAKGRKTTDGVWAVNLCRNWKNAWVWSSLTGGYANKGQRFRFTAHPAPVVQARGQGDPALPPCAHGLSVFNPTRNPLTVTASLLLVRNNMPELKQERTLTLAPGARQEVTLAVDANDPTTRYTLTARVAAPDGQAVYYERETRWARAKEPLRWVVGRPKDAPPVDLQFAYYPSKNLMRLRVDINGLPKDAKPAKVTATIREHWAQQVVKSVDFPLDAFKNGQQEQRVELPPLEGDYEIAVKAEGEKVPETALVKRFERRRFPWENTPAGRSPTVYPPFTPIKLNGKMLQTVLRTHTLNDLGLLDQVEATSANTQVTKPILAAPMRYTAQVGGAAVPVQAQPLKRLAAKPHEVVTEATFAAGALQATAKNTWDYDGTVKVELTLQPTGDTPVDALTLDIPFDAAAAPLLHANSDRIRAPIAQQVPTGQGVVWDATKVACDDFLKNFCPYIYLGSAVRGLCWFADNDKGWGWDPKTPNLQVVREGNQVILRVRIINTPTVIQSPRTLTFGLLAAPVKPPLNMAKDNPNGWRYRYLRDNYRLLGTDINWMGNRSCGSVYPMGGDLRLWELLAKASRERMSDAEIAAAVQYSHQACGGRVPEGWDDSVRYNLRNHTGGKMIFYYNRATSQELPEFETFKDEWCLDDLRAIGKGNGRGEIKIVPSDSFNDYNLYWYARSFEIGNNQGVYWDNWYICPSFNTVMTDAYTRPDGTIVPAAGIWAMRDLAKRTFVMMNERGMTPIVFPHMTSFNPLPMMAFATLQYEWEWKYSEGDVQDRFSREYLQLCTIGEQAGVWPVPLHDHGAKADDPWTQRTFTGVRLLHELDGVGGFGISWMKTNRDTMKLAKPVLDLLDTPGLQVYKYWEDRPQPVTTDHPDVQTIVYSVPGQEAVVPVVSYARQDATVTVTVDLKALGLEAGCKVLDSETNQELPLENGVITLPIKKHDLRLLRFTKGG